jgi:hypothetical protein
MVEQSGPGNQILLPSLGPYPVATLLLHTLSALDRLLEGLSMDSPTSPSTSHSCSSCFSVIDSIDDISFRQVNSSPNLITLFYLSDTDGTIGSNRGCGCCRYLLPYCGRK